MSLDRFDADKLTDSPLPPLKPYCVVASINALIRPDGPAGISLP